MGNPARKATKFLFPIFVVAVVGLGAWVARVARAKDASDAAPWPLSRLTSWVARSKDASDPPPWPVVVTPPPPFFAGLMTGDERHPPSRQPLPALHHPFKDPTFGTCITRITDPSQWPGEIRIRHYYSKANPFNADNTRAILWGGDGAYLLYDTKTWNPMRALRIGYGDAEVSWHPTDPNVFYQLELASNGNPRVLFRYDVGRDQKKQLRDFSEYLGASGKMEGNWDAKGRYYAMVGKRGENDFDAFVYDVEKDRVSARLKVPGRTVDDWVSVTPSGKYVVMMGKDRSRVYDINLKPVLELPEGSFGHGDLCIGPGGRDLLVYDGADHELNHNRNINIADLQTGKVWIGTRIGWSSTPHVSCRNLDLPGWALISTLWPDRRYPNRDFEIFWLKLDGSGEIRRVAHHHSDREEGGYFAESHAVPNRNGTKIIFASNWDGKTISAYLVDLTGKACEARRP